VILFSDNGPGIKATAACFDPFLTQRSRCEKGRAGTEHLLRGGLRAFVQEARGKILLATTADGAAAVFRV